MNKTLIAIGFLILILGAIVANVVLAIFAPEQLAAFNGAVITILGVGSAGITMIYGLGKQGQQLEQIRSNTNGTLSELRAERDAAIEENTHLKVQLAATTASGSGEYVAT